MFLKAWNLSSGEVEIHAADCADTRKINSRRKAPFPQDQVEFGKTDWTSKEAFCFDYWNNGILEEYEAEHGEFSFDVWQGMDFKPCCDPLQDNEPIEEPKPEPKPKPAPAKPNRGSSTKGTRATHGTGHLSWETKPVPEDMVNFAEWIEENFSETFNHGDIDPRIVAIAVRTYRFFQKSNLSLKATQNGDVA